MQHELRVGMQEAEGRAIRVGIYLILAMLATAWMSSRIMTMRSGLGGTPMLSANDRSRWSTVRALVDHGTYELDEVIFRPDGKRDREWYSIDMVVHRGADEREHFYSSKPPLLATLVAGEYWLVKKITGVSVADKPFYLIRLMMVLTNVLPLWLLWWLLASLLERCGTTDWGRMYVMAAATFGTFLTTFAVTLNNHLPAAISAAATGYALWLITAERRRDAKYFIVAGLAAAFAAANELPALLLLVGTTVVVFWAAPRRALWAFVIPALLVVVAFFATNWIAHQSWRPPYMHRHDGPIAARIATPAPGERRTHQAPDRLRQQLSEAGLRVSDEAVLRPREESEGWVLWDPGVNRRYALSWDGDQLVVRQWDDWYEYEGSYWTDNNKKGVDRGEQDPAVYAFHVLVGHHGVFSLTPIWLLSVWGGALWLQRGTAVTRLAVLSILAMAVICMGFYLARPEYDRNYGGVTTGFRWLFWQIPFWLFCLIPAADRLAKHRYGRIFAALLLAISAFSAMYGANNPWSHPWIFDYWTSLGWIAY